MPKRSFSTGKARLKFILKIIAICCAINTLSYSATLLWWQCRGDNGAGLEVVQRPGTNGVMIYLVAGCLNQPRAAFDFLLPDLEDYGVTLVNYRSDRGCDRKLIAQQVVDNARSNNYREALIITCSMGDYVGRYCEEQIDAYSIAICPAPDPVLLKPLARRVTRAGVPLARLITLMPLGWWSQCQWHNNCGDGFSLNFMVSQFAEIGFRADAPHCSSKLLGVIVAEADETGQGEDEFLKNREAMRAYFGDTVPIYSAKGVGHANTADGAAAYRAAWIELWSEARTHLEQ